MILGVQIINFDIFDNDQAGILIDESISPAREGGKRANPMRKLNALIGRNNTGKTSFMGCLAYMKDCVTDGVTAASISCGRCWALTRSLWQSAQRHFLRMRKTEGSNEGKAGCAS